MKAIAKKQNSKGIQYALVDCANGTFAVYKLCENYSRHVKGGIERAWRYVEKGMSYEAATALYARRTA